MSKVSPIKLKYLVPCGMVVRANLKGDDNKIKYDLKNCLMILVLSYFSWIYLFIK